MNNTVLYKLDWITVLLYFVLVAIGWVNIYSTTYQGENPEFFSTSTSYGSQMIFILISIVLIVFILFLEAKFYVRFSSIIYLLSIFSLLGLFVFGKNIAGATSWYVIGDFGLQPSEFAKTATTLALANYLSDIQTKIDTLQHQMITFLIILIPALLIIPQPDPGSALVFLGLFFVLYREGFPLYYLVTGPIAILIFVSTIMFGVVWVAFAMTVLLGIFYLLKNKKYSVSNFSIAITFILAIAFSLSVSFIFNHIFQQHHRNRINVWLRLEKNEEKLKKIRQTIGYNTYQSEKTISSGGFLGKGFLEGTRTKGKFVPEQHTDYIFSTVGEEWGFVGSSLVIILYMFFLLRLLKISERQKSNFSRIYGYGVVSILFMHIVVNIGMVIGLLPTIGIPLPFFSKGGSGLLGFTLLVFIFLRLDANRNNEWL